MKQYHNLLEDILKYGSPKPAAREGMPGTLSLFGYQQRYNLADGFPILTTKRVSFKNIVVELLWFLRGETNIKFLVDNNVNIWNQDAYNYYEKKFKEAYPQYEQNLMSFNEFVSLVKEEGGAPDFQSIQGYFLGDCGYQYGKVWRDWDGVKFDENWDIECNIKVDQLAKVIENIRTKPFDRRKLVTAVDPAHDGDLALYWCHSLFQFNCRAMDGMERTNAAWEMGLKEEYHKVGPYRESDWHIWFDSKGVPKYYLDCQMYQRSADVFLGVPYNISSYALLTHIVAKVCNMVPGQFVHTLGDVHIYDNHMDQVKELLGRDPGLHKLPKLVFGDYLNDSWKNIADDLSLLANIEPHEIMLDGYESYPGIKAELSTGMKK